MRGLLSIFVSTHPDRTELKRGLMVLACSDRYASRIVRAVVNRMPDVEWSVLQREETLAASMKGRVYFSREAEGTGRKWELLQRIRKERFDVVVTSWTNEPGFAQLKLLTLLSNARFMLAYNENIDALALTRDQWSVLLSHLRWRSAHRSGGGHLYSLKVALSWIFLFPLGVVYLISRTLAVVLREKFRSP